MSPGYDVFPTPTSSLPTMTTPHARRAAFLRFVIGTGILAAAAERKLTATARTRGELTVDQEDRLRRATRVANDVNRYLRQLARLGVDARLPDLAVSEWPDAATAAAIQVQLLRALRHDDFEAERYDFGEFDLSTLDLATADVRSFDDRPYRG